MNRVFIVLVLIATLKIETAYSQIPAELEEINLKKTNLSFCYENEQSDFPSFSQDLFVISKVFKLIGSKYSSIEFDIREKKIVFADTQTKIKDFRNIVHLVEEYKTEISDKQSCLREEKVKIFLRPIK